ncbi:MAG: hypothetical protein JRN45_00595 [Nitrososphaerota archaeon]|nr:hypothetical protein [Nitrososphaerota archaeon]
MLSTEFRLETILPGYMGLPKKLKEGVAMAMTDPVILPTERDAGWLPDWMLPAIKARRVKTVLDGGLPEAADDLEIVAYLMCASFDCPLAEDVVHTYFNVAGRTLPETFVQSMKENGIPTGPLDESQERLVGRTKRQMARDKKDHRTKGKWKAMARLLDCASIELGAFDLFVKEGRV